MKFDCGSDWLEKCDRWQRWHRWFAWRPVRAGSYDCRWLEWVERRGEIVHGEWEWHYRPLKAREAGDG